MAKRYKPHPNAKVLRNEEIRQQYFERYPLKEIAEYWGISIQRVMMICKGRPKKHLVDKYV